MKVMVIHRNRENRFQTEIYQNAVVMMEGCFVRIVNDGGFQIIAADRLIELRAMKDDV